MLDLVWFKTISNSFKSANIILVLTFYYFLCNLKKIRALNCSLLLCLLEVSEIIVRYYHEGKIIYIHEWFKWSC